MSGSSRTPGFLTRDPPDAFTFCGRLTRRDALLLLLLSSIWGASFLFIKVGVETLEPSVVVLGRLVFGALLLLALLPRSTTPFPSGSSASPRRASTRASQP